MEELVASVTLQTPKALGSSDNVTKDEIKRPAPSSGGCRIEGFVRVKKVRVPHLVKAHQGTIYVLHAYILTAKIHAAIIFHLFLF